MTIYAIILEPNVNNHLLGPAIAALFPSNHYAMAGNYAWLVSSNKTVKQVSDEIGLTNGEHGAGVIVEVASYFGRANPNIWNWIKINWETVKAPGV